MADTAQMNDQKSDPNVLVIKPVTPLKSNAHYMVVVTNALKSTSGEAARSSAFFTLLKNTTPLVDANGVSQVPGRDDATAASLESLRQLNQAMLAAAGNATPAIAAADVAVAWSFKTQTLGGVLTAVQAASAGNVAAADFYSNLVFTSTAFATANGLPAAAVTNIGTVVVGTANLPYYLDAPTPANPLGPVTGSFTIPNPLSPIPTLKSTQSVSYLLSILVGGGPWPVVIFQHGFTVDKSVMFGVANTLASAGFATIAIDAVLHGDRTFGLDLVNNTTGDAGPDGTVDASGQHYLNLTSLLTSRDNIRQSVIDLIHLTRLLEIQTLEVANNG
ncbi:MAG: hypothetical protein L3J61_06445, partial [Ghiorsea sp.]|nr:hypothetical protein [Ghiorsea sp.]